MDESAQETLEHAVYRAVLEDPRIAKVVIDAAFQGMSDAVRGADRASMTFYDGMVSALMLTDGKRLDPKMRELLSARVCAALEIGGKCQAEKDALLKYSRPA